jgi:hypothetical protein
MSFVSWVFDSLAGEDVIDLYFIMSDLVDINLTEAEIYESAHYDSLACSSARENSGNYNTPIGKQVL